MRTQRQVGDVLTFDFQGDIYRGQYRLLEHLGKQVWRAEHLPVTDEQLAEMEKYETEEYILSRVDEAGKTFEVRLVSREEYSKYF